ncbi:MAG: 23S rRNA (uracil(1939)-C(5))-methyltransferase RlmD [Bacillota bacterium]|nr:23S rRNA (uracil(1939)-C(5))-methyltransferase RlmD [Bacillota bacterium]
MKENIPVEKNKDYIIDITSMGFEGEGVGKINDFTVFVKGALVGERVEIKIIKITKNYAVGKLINILNISENRTEPVCGIYKRCGGCQLQHLSYEGQLNFKKQRVKDCLTRIGKLEVADEAENNSQAIVLHDTIGMKNPFKYRNKVQLPVGEENGEVRIGFYAPKSHDIIDMQQCHIQPEVGDKIIAIFRNWMQQYKIRPYDEQKGTGNIRHIMVRKGFKTGEVMVVIVTNEPMVKHVEKLIEVLTKEIEGLKSIVQNINSKKTNVILGQQCKTLWGSDVISDYIGDFKFNISPLSFFQVNPEQTEVLYIKALEYAGLTGDEIVFDAYCGTGTISLFLSQKAKKVYGVEIIPQAIENAKINAQVNNVTNAEFIVGESEKVIPDLINKGIKADVVVVDPPRKGCEKSLLESLAKMKPRRIVYVSCDPSTLARDLGILEELGYRTLEVQPVDMFPHTAHVETVVQLTRS